MRYFLFLLLWALPAAASYQDVCGVEEISKTLEDYPKIETLAECNQLISKNFKKLDSIEPIRSQGFDWAKAIASNSVAFCVSRLKRAQKPNSYLVNGNLYQDTVSRDLRLEGMLQATEGDYNFDHSLSNGQAFATKTSIRLNHENLAQGISNQAVYQAKDRELKINFRNRKENIELSLVFKCDSRKDSFQVGLK